MKMLLCWLTENYQAVIAICSLVVSIYALISIRKHHRLSCRPMLSLWMDKKKGVDNYPRVICTLTNTGLGPALIQDFSVYSNNKKINGVDAIEKALKDHIGSIQLMTTSQLNPGHCMAAGDSIIIFDITIIDLNFDWHKAKSKPWLKIRYKSLYGEKMPEFDSSQFK